jgi:hypothetical protein
MGEIIHTRRPHRMRCAGCGQTFWRPSDDVRTICELGPN